MTARPMSTPGDPLATRQSLLERLKNLSDQEGWQVFFNRYWRLIYGTAIKAGLSHAEAQEVVQESVIYLARKIHAYKYEPGVSSFKAWLLQLTRWRIANQFRNRHKLPHGRANLSDDTDRTPTIDRLPDPAGLDLDEIWETEWAHSILEAARERVKRKVRPEHFQIYEMYVREEWPVKKVAQKLGVSSAKVYLVKHRVERLMAKELKRLEREEI